jgi:hypothetical protein
MPKTKKPKTHFEQVPLEIVEKIVEKDVPIDEDENNVNVEPPAKK